MYIYIYIYIYVKLEQCFTFRVTQMSFEIYWYTIAYGYIL